MGNEVFSYSSKEFESLKGSLIEKFDKHEIESDVQDFIEDSIILSSGTEKTKVIFYKSGKAQIQGKKNKCFCLAKEILTGQVTEDKREISDEILYSESELIIGFDESGKGETIGDLTMAVVFLEREKADIFTNLKKDVKKMDLKDLNHYVDLIKKHQILYDYAIISPTEIDYSPIKINRLMDKKYLALLSKHAGRLNAKCALCMDDYGLTEELEQYLESRKKTNAKIIVEKQLDEKVIAVKLASIIARHIRLSSIKEIEEKNRLEGKISFGKGATNIQTEEWLIKYRELYPSREFPSFVRKSWGNVKKIEEKFPKSVKEVIFNCSDCEKKVSLVNCWFNPKISHIEFFCGSCGKLISIEELRQIGLECLLCDTNAFIGGIVSKDLLSEESLFTGLKIIRLNKIVNEIDTLKPSLQDGAHREFRKLREIANQDKIEIINLDYEITHPFNADEKLYCKIAGENSWVLISGDKNVVENVHYRGSFVIRSLSFDPRNLFSR